MASIKRPANKNNANSKKLARTFTEKVLAVVARIPKGKMFTYSEVAARAGSSGAFRAVGSIMSRNWDPSIPCHRVIRSDGHLGNYNRGAEKKITLLRKEGAIK